MTSRNWNSHPASIFPSTYNLQTFKTRVHKHLRFHPLTWSTFLSLRLYKGLSWSIGDASYWCAPSCIRLNKNSKKCRTTSFANTFVPMTSKNWNSLTASEHLQSSNLQNPGSRNPPSHLIHMECRTWSDCIGQFRFSMKDWEARNGKVRRIRSILKSTSLSITLFI